MRQIRYTRRLPRFYHASLVKKNVSVSKFVSQRRNIPTLRRLVSRAAARPFFRGFTSGRSSHLNQHFRGYSRYGLGFSFFPLRFYGWVATTPISTAPSLPSREAWDQVLRRAAVSCRAGVDFPHLLLRDLALVSSLYSYRLLFPYLVDTATVTKSRQTRSYHNLILKFNYNRLYVSVLDPVFKRNYFSLRPGLLLRYQEGRKKGTKKTLPSKLLLMRLLRKLLIVSRLDFLVVLVKGVPMHLPQLFSFLNRPLPHRINDPVSGVSIDETGDDYHQFTYQSIQFVRGKPYGYQKTRKRGRIKRKIRRKIISTARVVDEL